MRPNQAAAGLAMLALVAATGCTSSPPSSVTPPAERTDAASSPSAPTAVATSSAPAEAPTPEVTEPGPVLGAFDGDGALAFATALAAMGTRDAGTEGDLAAREAVTTAFEESGWTVTEEPFDLPQGGSSANLVATLDPEDVDGTHVVVGGHLDTRGGSPGANDNGSGIGVLVALARELADERPAVPIVLVAFGAEEFQPSEPRQHHIGSTAYASRRGEDVAAALVVDMVGNGPLTCICWYDEGPRTLADRLLAVARANRLDHFEVQRQGDLSDHGPFAHQGRPAAFLWTFNDGVLHTPADTADRLRVEDIQRAGDLALAFVRSLTAQDAVRLAVDVPPSAG